jgi:glycolate oxidase iron-sulfur subunit
MQTNLAEFIRDTDDGREAEAILRNCVHCGFCTATCPTYGLLGDELDGPRGRIYLIKSFFEGGEITRSTQVHLDRCLTCRNCESTCPSGVQYGRLVEIGRKQVEKKVSRPLGERLMRRALASTLPNGKLFGIAMKAGRGVRLLLPKTLRDKVPKASPSGAWPTRRHARQVLMLGGCVQPSMLPNINSATARVLDKLGIETLVAPSAGCCGALRLHLNYHDDALDDVRRNIDAWWPYVEGMASGVDGTTGHGAKGPGVEAIVMNASGCGATVREYGHLLRNDPAYAHKAQRISALTRDISELLADCVPELARLAGQSPARRVAYHPPCTLQHGQKVHGTVEAVLAALGVDAKLPADKHLCCGSAGTYSVLNPGIANALRERKLGALQKTGQEGPDLIVTGNVGCITHLQAGTGTPVRHWIELVDVMLA